MINELIDKTLDNLGIKYYYLERPSNVFPCVVYSYNEYTNATGDNEEESIKYDVYFNIITKKDLNLYTRLLKDVLKENGFIKSVINSPVKFEGTDYYQITFNYIKTIAL